MRVKLTNAAYDLYVNLEFGNLVVVFSAKRYLAEGRGYIVAPDFSSLTEEEESMFKMLYPSVDLARIKVDISKWESYDGKLNRFFYTMSDLENS